MAEPQAATLPSDAPGDALAAPVQAPSDEQITQALRSMLDTTDLATTTERQLRKQLEQQFAMDLTDRKGVIREEVERFLQEQEPIEEEDDGLASDGVDPVAPKQAGSGFGSTLSEPMAAFLGETSLPRTQVVKRIWEYIKANDLQDPKNRRKIICDDKMKTIFTPPIDMLSMNKQLSKHCFTSGGVSTSEPRKRKSTPSAPREKKAKKAAGEKREPSKNNAFKKQIRVTSELSEWLGGRAEISRPELTSYFWHYVKEHELQDPTNKKTIVSDDKLKQLTGEPRFSGFGFMKYLSKHLLPDQ